MRIKENNEENIVNYTKLEAGDCFRYEGELFIKSNCKQEAVGLADGHALCDMCGNMVTPVNAEVQIIN